MPDLQGASFDRTTNDGFRLPTRGIPTGQRAEEPGQSNSRTQTSSRIPHGLRHHPVRRTRLRRSLPRGSKDVMTGSCTLVGYPKGLHERALDRPFRSCGQPDTALALGSFRVDAKPTAPGARERGGLPSHGFSAQDGRSLRQSPRPRSGCLACRTGRSRQGSSRSFRLKAG